MGKLSHFQEDLNEQESNYILDPTWQIISTNVNQKKKKKNLKVDLNSKKTF